MNGEIPFFISYQLFKLTPCDCALPIRHIVHIVYLKTYPWIFSHHFHFHSLISMGINKFTIIGIADRHHIGYPLSMAADTANIRYGNNYYWADSLSVANQIYPTNAGLSGGWTVPQSTDFPDYTSYLPANYKPGDTYDGTKAIQKNKKCGHA